MTTSPVLVVLLIAAASTGTVDGPAPPPDGARADAVATSPASSLSTSSSALPSTAPAPVDVSSPSAELPTPTFHLGVSGAPQDALRFADHLFLDGDWYRAITEYRRFLWQVRGRGPDAERAALAIGEALARGEQWDAAGRQLDGVAQRAADLSLRHVALYAAGRAYLLDGRPELAKPRFRLVVEEPETDAALQAQARWLLAWGHLDAGELERARVLFREVAMVGGAHADDAQALVGAIDARNAVAWKSPLLAGMLSLIPGLGHFYLGQWSVGVTSLVWNSVFLFAAAWSWLAGDIGVAVVLTLVELGWYTGGMFGAVAGAYRHNRDAVRNWRDEVLALYGASRALPAMHEVSSAAPGTLVRFTGAF